MRSDSDGGVSMRYSALAANGNKEWILKNFNLKDHSDENVVSIIGSFSPKVFQLKKLALGWALTAARFTGKENDSLNFGISTLWL